MAYQRTSERLLAGGVNLAMNPDLLPADQAQVITNADYAAQGGLRSRFGSALVFATAGPVTQILPANGHRYTVGGGQVEMDGAGIGAAGDAQSIASFQSYVWCIAASKKHNGTDLWNWSIDPPTKPVKGVASNVGGTVIVPAGAAWTVNPVETGTGAGGDGFIVQTIGSNTYTATFTGGTDLSSFHIYDKVRFHLFFKQAKALGVAGVTSGVTVQIDVNDGSFTQDYYSCEIPRKWFKGLAPREWRHLNVRFVALASDPDTPAFTRSGNTPGKDWSTVTAVRIIVDSNASTRIKIGQIDAIGDVKELLEGQAIQYYQTFVNKDGHESNPGPVSSFIKADRQAVDVTEIQVSADPQVTGVFLYRTDETLGATYRVTSKPLTNGTTTFHDDNGDSVLTGIATQMVVDNDPPPKGVGVAGPYQGRLLVWGGTKASRLYWSKQLMPFAFRNPDGPDGAWTDVGDDGDAIQAITIRPNVAYIYKRFDIFYLAGDPEGSGGQCQRTNARMGVAGPNAVAQGTNVDYFASQSGQGVYQFSGDTATKISAAIDPIFKGEAKVLPSGAVIPPVGNWSTMALGFSGSRLYLSYDGTGLVWNSETGQWRLDDRGFTSLYPDSTMLAGTAAGDVLSLESGFTDNGQAINVVYEKTFDAGLPDTEKTWQDLTIQFDGGVWHADVYAGTVWTSSLAASETFTFAGRQVLKLTTDPLNPVRSIAITIRLTCLTTEQVNLSGVWVNYYEHARQGQTFDTSTQSYGTELMKRAREAIIELENNAPVTIELLTDHPGVGMAIRDSKTIQSGTRRLEHIVWTQDTLGYLHRHFLFGSDMHVFSLRALIQPIGTFILGDRGEFWSSDPIDWGKEWQKWMRELQIVYASSGTAILTLESDQPATEATGQLAVRATFNLPSTSASTSTANEERSMKLKLPPNIKGREFRARVTPNADMRIEALRAYVKMIGVTGTTAWEWLEFPVAPTADGKWIPVERPPDQVV